MKYILVNGVWEVVAHVAAVPQGLLLVLVAAGLVALGAIVVLVVPRWGAIKKAVRFKSMKR